MTEKLIMHGNTNDLGAGHDPVNFKLKSPQSESGLPAPGTQINPNQQLMKKKNTLISKITKAALLLAAVVAPLTTAQAQLTQIFPVTQVWSYDVNCHDGENFQAVGFNDAGWATGPGGFTGGENNVAIVPILNTTSLPAPNSAGFGDHAMYFRTHFNIASTAGLSLIMSNAIDDGAVFYLNGSQILNLRVTTPGTCASFSTGAIGTGTDALLWEVHTFTPADLAGILVAGDNVLAVEVHQVNATSSDMVFGMILMSTTATITQPGPIAFTNGTGVITFDTAPPASQWSTMTWAGGNTSITDFTTLDTAAKTNSATIITAPLATVANDPPTDNNIGIWSTAAQAIATRPTGVAYSGIMATLSNATATAINSFGIRYNLKVDLGGQAGPEQIAGQLVYYSTSGTPGSWTQIPELSDSVNDQLAGTYAKSADLSVAWPSHTLLYILWVDDNAINLSPDFSYEIDNAQFVTLTPTPPAFGNNTDPTNRTVLQCASTTLSAGFATGTPTPTYQWYRTNGTPRAIVGATSASYTIPNMQASDAGTYFVVAANGNLPNATSHVATVTFSAAATFAAVRAVSGTNQLDILISFNLPVDPSTIDPNAFGIDVHERGGGASVGVNSATVVDGTNVLVIAFAPMTIGTLYDVEFQNPVANTCTAATVSGNVHVSQSVFLLQIDANQMWRYNDSGVAPAAQGGLTWIDPGWNDSAWPQGLAALDAKRGEVRTDITNIPVRTQLVLTNNLYNPSGTNELDIPTYNFRAHLAALPYGVPNALQAISFFDDGGRVYINGTVAFTNRDDPTNVFGVYSGAGAVSAETTLEGPFNINPSVLTSGENVVAVELKQTTATSSDATMGLILVGIYDSFAPRLTATTDRSFQQTDLTWTTGILQYNTNLSRGSGWHDAPGATSPAHVYWAPGTGPGHANGTNTLFFRLR